MYCGDETGSFVGDVGSHVSRFGYGGEDAPKYVVPSYIARSAQQPPITCYNPRLAADSDLTPALRMATCKDYSQPVTDPSCYLPQGDQIEDWDAYEQLWQSSFDALSVRDTLKHTKGGSSYKASKENANTETTASTATNTVASTTIQSTAQHGQGQCVHPLLVVSPGCTHRMQMGETSKNSHRKELQKITELMMETMNCRALFIAPTAMLAAFSLGRQTALVVDVGAGGCKVTPVVDGLLLKQSQRRSGRGGDWLGNMQWKALLQHRQHNENDKPGVVRARYQMHPKYNAAAEKVGIFHRWAMQDLMYEFRTSGHVHLASWCSDPTVPFAQSTFEGNAAKPDDAMEVETSSSNAKSTTYTLPDGTEIDLTSPVGKDLCRTPELLFTDDLPFGSIADSSTTPAATNQHKTLSNLPVHKLIHESLSAVGDIDTRKDLATSILLCGAASHGLEQRLSWEVSQTTTFKTKVLASRFSVERSCAAWIGGSILTSLGSFQQLWLSRDEYDEYGATLAVQRFP